MAIAELKKMIYSKKTWLILGFFLLVSIGDVMLGLDSFIQTDTIEHKMLLASKNQGHIAAIALFWIFPVYGLFLTGERMIREHQRTIDLIEKTRCSGKQWLRAKLLINGSVLSGIVGISLIVNMLLVRLILKPDHLDFKNPVGEMIELGREWQWFTPFTINHPTITYLFYIFMACFILFLLSCLITLVAIALPERKVAYPALVLYWMIWWFLPWDMSMVLQPFTEYGISYALACFGCYSILTLLAIFIMYRKVLTYDHL